VVVTRVQQAAEARQQAVALVLLRGAAYARPPAAALLLRAAAYKPVLAVLVPSGSEPG
jgi:hypothetical protein